MTASPNSVDGVDPANDTARVRARVCHPSGTPPLRPTVAYQAPDMTSLELRDAVEALPHRNLVAVIMTLCTGTYPRIARDSVITELARRDLADQVTTTSG